MVKKSKSKDKDGLILSIKERETLVTIARYASGVISRKQAATILGINPDYVSTLKRKYLSKGRQAFRHGNHTKTPVNRIEKNSEILLRDLYRQKYEGFSFTHFYEFALENGDLEKLFSSQEIPTLRTVGRILGRGGIRSPWKHKPGPSQQHPRRAPRESFGELVQLDGSVHDWLSTGEKCTLHIMIDDATGINVAGYFEKTETTHAYFVLFEHLIIDHGIPLSFYGDRRTSFEKTTGTYIKDGSVQFRRVCDELGVQMIVTSIPQAKGRVERCFRTHQSRLVNEFKIKGIKTIEEANAYLPGYLTRYNVKYARAPKSGMSSFRQYDNHIELNLLFSMQYPKKVLSGNVISHRSVTYMPVDEQGKDVTLLPSSSVVYAEALDGSPYLKHGYTFYKLRKVGDFSSNGQPAPVNSKWMKVHH